MNEDFSLRGEAPLPLPLSINGRQYRVSDRPVVVICFDGCDPAYLAAARQAGVIPNLVRMMEGGFSTVASAAMPTFTNPNNVAIACGAPPSVTGVAGNYYLDRATGREVMVLDGHQMRVDTIFSHYSAAGVGVAVVTAKDKLLRALCRNSDGIALSAESPEAAMAEIGSSGPRQAPQKYSSDLSLFVLDAGVALLAANRFRIGYLSLSDYVQHKHAPDEPEALRFMQHVDARVGQLLDLGAIIGIVADHGMNDMADAEGQPRVTYVQDRLEAQFGAGSVRVICPITDPFVRHHASLGGFVRVYLRQPDLDAEAIRASIAAMPGVEAALSGPDACERFDLPLDAEADIVVVGALGHALGATRAEHDLSALAGQRLRSHGSSSERSVPFILSHPVTPDYAARAQAGLRNFDIFDFAINGVTP